jgi:hypothetical protein
MLGIRDLKDHGRKSNLETKFARLRPVPGIFFTLQPDRITGTLKINRTNPSGFDKVRLRFFSLRGNTIPISSAHFFPRQGMREALPLQPA